MGTKSFQRERRFLCGTSKNAANYQEVEIYPMNGTEQSRTLDQELAMQKIQTDVTAKADKVSTDAAKVEGYAKAAQYLIGYNKKNILTVFLYEE